MVISQTKNASKRSPLSSSCKSKAKQGIAWELKKKLAHERLMALDIKLKSQLGVSVTMATPIRSHCPPEAKPNSELGSCAGVLTSAMERANEVQRNLSPHCPSFVKLMLKSHVSGGFWLGLPSWFCHAHLPEHDDTVVLVDEKEQEYDTNYLVDKTGLSGGWRGFSLAHKLLEGDVLVFHLIEPCKFKIYIVRARRVKEVDGAVSLRNLDVHGEPSEAGDQHEEQAEIRETPRPEHLQSLSANNHEKKNTGLRPISEPVVDQSPENIGSENVDGLRFSKHCLTFKDVKSFKDFQIQVDGLILDSQLPLHLRTKYYELCQSQMMFLHDHLISGLNGNLAAGMISETITIADAIRAANPSTDPNHLESWDKTLKAFEDLGMVVGFLRARIRKVLSICRESEAMIELKIVQRAEAEDEMRTLSAKLLNVGALITKLDSEIIDALKAKNEEMGIVFKEVACAPW